jgi:hypothetical protein
MVAQTKKKATPRIVSSQGIPEREFLYFQSYKHRVLPIRIPAPPPDRHPRDSHSAVDNHDSDMPMGDSDDISSEPALSSPGQEECLGGVKVRPKHKRYDNSVRSRPSFLF